MGTTTPPTILGRPLVPIFLMVLLLGSAPAGSFAGPAGAAPTGFEDHSGWPDTRVAHLARELIDIINSKDSGRALRFIRENYDPEVWKDFPEEQNAEWLSGIVERQGALVFYRTRTFESRASGDEIFVILRDETRQSWRRVGLELDPNPPHKIRGMTVMPAEPPSDLASEWSALEPAEFVSELAAYLTRMTDQERFSGAVLVARDGEVLFRKAYGKASRRFDIPNREDTLFNLASMNKMFTAVAVMQLVENGKLELDGTLDHYLPEGWLDRALASRITIRQLLSHTSGLGDYLETMWDRSRLLYREIEDYRSLLSDAKLRFEPGTDWAYSNTGFLLLGVIVQEAADMSYHDYLRAKIFEPAGMTATACYDMDRPVPNLAIGHSPVDPDRRDAWEENTLKHALKGGPAGGGYSTVDDLLRFDRALRGNVLVSESSKRLLWTATELSKNRWPYGYGFDIRGREGDRWVGHAGKFPGISSDLGIGLESGWTVVILSNIDGGAMLVRQKIDHDLGRIRTRS